MTISELFLHSGDRREYLRDTRIEGVTRIPLFYLLSSKTTANNGLGIVDIYSTQEPVPVSLKLDRQFSIALHHLIERLCT